MTKKERLRRQAIECMKKGQPIVLFMTTPESHGETSETISVRPGFVHQKLLYIEEKYDDDLKLKANPLVTIKYFA